MDILNEKEMIRTDVIRNRYDIDNEKYVKFLIVILNGIELQ